MEQKLSLVAQFDDNSRLLNSIINEKNALYSAFVKLLENGEENRIKWLAERNELKEVRKELETIKYEKKCLDTTVRNLRFSLNKEMQLKDKLQKDFEQLRHNTKMAIGFLTDKASVDGQREKILSCFNLNQLDPVFEENSSDESISDLDYDKTDEDILDEPVGKRKSTEKRHSGSKNSAADVSKRSRLEDMNIDKEEHSPCSNNLDDNNKQLSISRSLFQSESDLKNNSPIFITSRMPNVQSTPVITRNDSIFSKPTPSSTILCQPIESRIHTFITKKVYSIGKTCGPCGGAIGFCSACLHCRDCKAMCHIECKEKVALPCVPVITPSSTGKSGRLLLIADFVPGNTRPRIPALIVHCCKEVEKRGLSEEGIYRIPGSLKDVKQLKESILSSKTGMPSLNNIDIHVICSCIKDFLRSLDEQLTTRVLWRDFVAASAIENEDERTLFLLQAIDELPIANRDTLAFVMLHLQKVAQAQDCKMPISNLSRIFGPAIVGNTVRDPSSWVYTSEQPKQIQVVEALLNLPSEHWNALINPTIKDTTIDRVRQSNRYSNVHQVRGGSISVGTLTPMRYKVTSGLFKPLF